MSLTEYIKHKRFGPGKGVTQPPPERGIKLFFFVLHTHFWELIKLNLLFLTFCIPVLTIPAAFCAANRVILNLVQNRNCYLWNDFFAEFKESFLKSLPFGLLFAFLIFDSIIAFTMSLTENGVNIPSLALAFFLLGSSIIFFNYVFIFLPALALKNRYIAKNAFIFLMTEWKTNIIILSATAVMIFTLLSIAAYSILPALLVFVFFYFSFMQLIICTAVNQPMIKRIVEPFEQSQNLI